MPNNDDFIHHITITKLIVPAKLSQPNSDVEKWWWTVRRRQLSTRYKTIAQGVTTTPDEAVAKSWDAAEGSETNPCAHCADRAPLCVMHIAGRRICEMPDDDLAVLLHFASLPDPFDRTGRILTLLKHIEDRMAAIHAETCPISGFPEHVFRKD